jgi:gliding motility-associated-like protein
MLAILDSMVAILTPEMPAHTARWNGSVSQWQTNVQTLRNFINSRCKGVQTGMNTCYGLSGPYDFCIDINPSTAGTVLLNSTTIYQFPDSGIYYGGIKTFLTAASLPNYAFDHWEISSNDTVYNSLKDTAVFVKLTKDDCITAYYNKITKPEIVVNINNVFSPNGDNANDLFSPISPIQEFNSPIELTIFDRWGKQVYRNANLKTGWDGKSGGQDCSDGTYFWMVKYLDENGQILQKRGFVSLVR